MVVQNAITLAANQWIGIDPNANTVNARIQTPIAIDSTTNAVSTTIQHPVAIDQNANTVVIDRPNKHYNALNTRVITHGLARIDNKNSREQLLLTADHNNVDPVWLGNHTGDRMPLFPSEKLTLPTNRRLAFSGTDNDQVYIGEILKV